MRLTLITLAAAAMLSKPPASSGSAPPADVSAFLGAVARAYGGTVALDRVHAYRLEGHLNSKMTDAETPTIRVWARPDRFKALVDYEGHPEARVVNGDDVWRNDPGGPFEPAEGSMRSAVLLQSARAGIPWTLIAHAAEARLLPDEPPPIPVEIRVDGRRTRLVAIEVPLGRGMRLRAWADSLGRIRVSQGLVETGESPTHFETLYDDFRSTGGVLFAFHETGWASGQETGSTTIERVLLDPPLRPDEFHPPADPDSASRHGGS